MRNFTAEGPNKIWLGDITYILVEGSVKENKK
jgi:hypothetical protein